MEAFIASVTFSLRVTSITVGINTSKLARHTIQMVSIFACNTYVGINGTANRTVFVIANKLALSLVVETVPSITVLAIILSRITKIAEFISAIQHADTVIVSITCFAFNACLFKWVFRIIYVFTNVTVGISAIKLASAFAVKNVILLTFSAIVFVTFASFAVIIFATQLAMALSNAIDSDRYRIVAFETFKAIIFRLTSSAIANITVKLTPTRSSWFTFFGHATVTGITSPTNAIGSTIDTVRIFTIGNNALLLVQFITASAFRTYILVPLTINAAFTVTLELANAIH
jgi:hypothetical protein